MTSEGGFDPGSWSGDADELREVQERLSVDLELCERTFAYKHEAFTAGLHLGRIQAQARIDELSESGTARIRAIIGDTPRDDTETALKAIDQALKIAMDASRAEFRFWEDNVDDAPLGEEFSVGDRATLSAEWRFALAARHLRTIALAWGLSTEFDHDNEIGTVTTDATAASTPVRRILSALGSPGDHSR